MHANANLKAGIYSIVHKDSGKRYIGSSRNWRHRLAVHRCNLQNRTHVNGHLQSAWDKYGANAFVFSPVLICDHDDLLFYEQLIMDSYKTHEKANGYNLRVKAESNVGYKCLKPRKPHSAETRAKISASKFGRPNPAAGKRAYRAPWNKGIPITEEARAKLSNSLKGKPAWNKGIPLTEEVRNKLSEVRKGRPSWNKGKAWSKEFCDQMSAAQLGKKKGPYRSGNAVKTHCPKGHLYSGENLYIHPKSKKRGCKACVKIQSKSSRENRGLS